MATEDIQKKIFKELSGLQIQVREMIGLGLIGNPPEESSDILPLQYRLTDVAVLSDIRPVEPFKDIDDVLAALEDALENVENPLDVERLLDGIARFCSTADVKNLTGRTGDLRRKIAQEKTAKADGKGLLAQNAGLSAALSDLLLTWLDGKHHHSDEQRQSRESVPFTFFISRIHEIRKMVEKKQPAPLLSLPTHEYGWIAPESMVERLEEARKNGQIILRADFMQALLRLAPDGRAAALEKLQDLPGHQARVLRWALGAEDGPQPKDALHYDIWIAAARAHDPEGDFQNDFAGLLLEDKLPDSLEHAKYSWRAGSGKVDKDGETHTIPRIHVHIDPYISPDEAKRVWDAYQSGSLLAGVAKSLFRNTKKMILGDLPTDYRRIPTATMHRILRDEDGGTDLTCSWAVAWLAMLWPLNLDGYFTVGLRNIMDGINSGGNGADGAFLRPLFEFNRPWTEMSRVCLAAALLSPEGRRKNTAVAVLTEGIRDGRADAAEFARIFARINDGGWLKARHLHAALAAVAEQSPLHQVFVGNLLQEFIVRAIEMPEDSQELFGFLENVMRETGQLPKPSLKEKLADIDADEAYYAAAQKIAALATGNPVLALEAQTRIIEARLKRARKLFICTEKAALKSG
jgi:hypothetical protein